jgi:hypothetical protein
MTLSKHAQERAKEKLMLLKKWFDKGHLAAEGDWPSYTEFRQAVINDDPHFAGLFTDDDFKHNYNKGD